MCIYIQSGQCLTKTYLRVIFANSNVPEKPFQICFSENERSLLADDTANAFKRNMLYKYINRPNQLYANEIYFWIPSITQKL